MGKHVFISYNRGDRAYVDRLAAHLRARGLPVWFDFELVPGERFARMIRKRIEESFAMVVVATPASVASDYVELELTCARDLGIPIFPLLLEGERLPFLVLNLHYDDVRGEVMPSAVLLGGLSAAAGTPLAEERDGQEEREGGGTRRRLPSALRWTVAASFALLGVYALSILAAGGLPGASPWAAPSRPVASQAASPSPGRRNDSGFAQLPPGSEAVLGHRPAVEAGPVAPTTLASAVLFQGAGQAVTQGDAVTINYVLLSYVTGKELAGSWDGGGPVTYGAGHSTVLPGLEQKIAGVRVGTRLLIDVPADLAYGDRPKEGLPAGALRYIVDVLAANPPMPSQQ